MESPSGMTRTGVAAWETAGCSSIAARSATSAASAAAIAARGAGRDMRVLSQGAQGQPAAQCGCTCLTGVVGDASNPLH
ncbi:hypothetical protein HDA40_001179 [Hamadaea flava]|uniref:Uncharacterized protein n=1 Tax=Hamadaea flava TaxID=1742688 RepID=A0ABV8LNX2_9ACTN|nr:hypothetical protein [Hamadaea flava]MCP2322672.1 hypothetical protein [Hamadaea flava]